MIIGNINNIEKTSPQLHKIDEIIKKVMALDPLSLPVGTTELDGKNIFFNRESLFTKPLLGSKPEVHNFYIDIHIILSGSETIWTAIEPASNEILESMTLEKDIAFIDDKKDSFPILLSTDHFAIFYPGEIHKPLIAIDEKPAKLEKLVVKIKKDFFHKG